MSRSYKKQPIIKSAPVDGTYGKKSANSAVRRYKDIISSGKAYRKLYESYNIHDHISRYTYENYVCFYERSLAMHEVNARWYTPKHHSYADWYKMYKRK